MGNKTSKKGGLPGNETGFEYLEKKSRLPKEKIIEQYDSFIKGNPDGYITREKMLNSIKNEYTNYKGNAEKLANFLLNLIDSNNDGKISFSEYIIWLGTYNVLTWNNELNEGTLNMHFDQFDTNHDNKIDKQELIK